MGHAGHLCFGDDREIFLSGVPVPKSIVVLQDWSRKWRLSLPNGHPPYWTGQIKVLHNWEKPTPDWRLLHTLEAAMLIGLNPWLGAVHCFSQNGSGCYVEFRTDCRQDNQIFVSCGSTVPGHHAAYVQGPSNFRIIEERIN